MTAREMMYCTFGSALEAGADRGIGFSFEGSCISDPYLDIDGHSDVNPRVHYGFEPATLGGIDALRLEDAQGAEWFLTNAHGTGRATGTRSWALRCPEEGTAIVVEGDLATAYWPRLERPTDFETWHGHPWSRVADGEGWNLFDSGSYGVEIQRDDEGLFDNDLRALMHVFTEAAANEEGAHYCALEIYARENPVGYRRDLQSILGCLPGEEQDAVERLRANLEMLGAWFRLAEIHAREEGRNDAPALANLRDAAHAIGEWMDEHEMPDDGLRDSLI